MIRPLLRDQPDSALRHRLRGRARPEPPHHRPARAPCWPTTGIPVVDRIVVHDGRWRSLDCADPDCCPPDGTPGCRTRRSVPRVAAEFVGAGVAPLPGRVDLQDSVEAQAVGRAGPHDHRPDRRRQARKPDRRGSRRDAVADAWARVLDPRPDAPPLSGPGRGGRAGQPPAGRDPRRDRRAADAVHPGAGPAPRRRARAHRLHPAADPGPADRARRGSAESRNGSPHCAGWPRTSTPPPR